MTPDSMISALSDFLVSRIFTETVKNVTFQQSQAATLLSISANGNATLLLKSCFRYLNAFYAQVVDQVVLETLLVKTCLVYDYSNSAAITATTATKSLPFCMLLLEVLCAHTFDEELQHELCRVIIRCKLANPTLFFGELQRYAQIFPKFTIVLITDKTLAGALLGVFCGLDDVFSTYYQAQHDGLASTPTAFFGQLRRVIERDMRDIIAVSSNEFYAEKLYGFLEGALERAGSNEPLFAVGGGQLERLMI